MRTLIDYACRAASLGQDIGWIELAIRLAFLAAALVGGLGLLLASIGVLGPGPHHRLLYALLIGAFGFTALATSHTADDKKD